MVRPAAKRAIRIGVSACLLGERVRYDGGHRRDAFIAGPLARLATLVPVCPEVEVGMGTPRPPIRLVRIGGRVRLLEPGAGSDHAAAMRAWSRRRLRELEREELSGFVLKARSPSCGLEVDVFLPGDRLAARRASGIFAAELRARWPGLPVAEEARLRTPAARRRFVERVLAYHRARASPGAGGKRGVARGRARR